MKLFGYEIKKVKPKPAIIELNFDLNDLNWKVIDDGDCGYFSLDSLLNDTNRWHNIYNELVGKVHYKELPQTFTNIMNLIYGGNELEFTFKNIEFENDPD